MAEARWASSAIYHAKLTLTKQELRAEAGDLTKTLEDAETKLRGSSAALDYLIFTKTAADTEIGVSINEVDSKAPNPLDLADQIGEMIAALRGASPRIDKLPLKARNIRRSVATELAMRVIPIAERFGINVTAAAIAGTHGSQAVKLLKEVADSVGLVYSEVTWRDLIADAKKKRPDVAA